MRFGCTIWCVSWNPPYENAIKRIAKMGCKGVELITWDRKTLDEYYTRKKNKELRELIESLGLELTGFNFPMPNVTSLKKEDQETCLSNFKRQVEVASELGAKVITGSSRWVYEPWGIPGPNAHQRPLMQTFGIEQRGIPYEQDFGAIWNSYVNLMKKFADVVEDAGYRYAIEIHAFELLTSVDGLLRLIDAVGSKAIGMNMDMSFIFSSLEFLPVAILKMKGKIFHTHLNDTDNTAPFHWRPGKGKTDWFGVLKALKAAEYNWILTMEVLTVPGAAIKDVRNDATPEYEVEIKKAIEFLRSAGKEAKVDFD